MSDRRILVSFLPGTSGNFLAIIFSYLLNGTPLSGLILETGSAHNNDINWWDGDGVTLPIVDDQPNIDVHVQHNITMTHFIDNAMFQKYRAVSNTNPAIVQVTLNSESEHHFSLLLTQIKFCLPGTPLEESYRRWRETLQTQSSMLLSIEEIKRRTAPVDNLYQLPFDKIINKDTAYLLSFIKEVASQASISVTQSQSNEIQLFMKKYFAAQPDIRELMQLALRKTNE